MVKLLVLLLISVGQLHAASLSLLPEKSQIMQGRSLTVNMIYVGPTSPDELNVKRWQTQVFIKKGEREEQRLMDGRVEVKQRLTLYPKRSGLLTMGPLALGGAKSKRFDLRVMPALVNQVDITPRWSALPDQLWQGESIESCVHMPLSEQRSRVKVELPQTVGISVVETQNRTLQSEGQPIEERCWRFSSQQPGNYLLELPPIIQRGRGRWTFYLPAQTIEILPLPSYLPNSISVGKPDIQVQSVENGWTISIQGIGGQAVEPQWGIRGALAKATNISVDQILDSDGQIYVPYKRWSIGQRYTAKLPYFNTVTGRLDSIDVQLNAPWNIPTIAIVLLSIAAIALLIKATLIGVGLIRRRERLKTLKQLITSATSADQLRSVVLASGLVSSDESAPYKTLQHWVDAQGDQEAVSLANSLNQLTFSNSVEEPLEEIKRTLINRLMF